LHGVLNFSKAKLDTDAFRASLRKEKAWSRSNYQIEIKNLHSNSNSRNHDGSSSSTNEWPSFNRSWKSVTAAVMFEFALTGSNS
jgi:hypothetical protein